MKTIILGFAAIGLFTLVGCRISKNSRVNKITDLDGNVYNSVTIGTQEWMTENLRTTKYSDGTPIINVTDVTEWRNMKTGAWCYYENDSQNDSLYGKLYNWYAVETEKLCPSGWHVPTYVEWTVLTDYLAANGHNGAEGAALKNTSGWNYNGNGTDDFGWLGLPGGRRDFLGEFVLIGNSGSWWSTKNGTYNARVRYINGYDASVSIGGGIGFEIYGFSVRCLKD